MNAYHYYNCIQRKHYTSNNFELCCSNLNDPSSPKATCLWVTPMKETFRDLWREATLIQRNCN